MANYGDRPWLRKQRTVQPEADRFRDKIAATSADSCWMWVASTDHATGYGKFRRTYGNTAGAHRVAYELFVGPVPDGMELDHLCKQPGCVNPAHLEPVTSRENSHRSDRWAGDETCPRGHLRSDPDNAGTRRGGFYYCKACSRERRIEYYARKKAEAGTHV